MSKSRAYQVAVTAVSTCMVTAATMAIQVYIPATEGYFNIGEVMVYTVALLFGARIGFFAGGVGSALADLISVTYAFYAPATLIVKGLEGMIVGKLSRIKFKVDPKAVKALSLLLAAAISLGFWSLTSSIYVGEAEVTLAFSTFEASFTNILWAALSILMFIILALYLWRAKPENLSAIISILLGGSVMVLGYYLYEQLILGYYALAEVPANIGQMLVGLFASIPLSEFLKKTVKLLQT